MELGIAHPPIPIVINFRKQLLEGLQGAYPAAMASAMVVFAKGGCSCELHSCRHSCWGVLGCLLSILSNYVSSSSPFCSADLAAA